MYVSQIPALQKHVVRRCAAVPNFDGPVGCEPIRTVCAERDSLASYGTVANNVSLVRVAVQITRVPVEESALRGLNQAGQVGKSGLRAQIQVRKPGDLGH